MGKKYSALCSQTEAFTRRNPLCIAFATEAETETDIPLNAQKLHPHATHPNSATV